MHPLKITSLLALASISALLSGGASHAVGQTATGQIGPGGQATGNVSDLAISGDRLTVWSEPEGTRLLLYSGNFRARSEARLFSSQRAVIWLSQSRRDGLVHNRLQLYLEGTVRITEPGGATTEDEVLLTELDTVGRLTVEAIERVDEARRDDPLYQRAVEALRQSGQQELIKSAEMQKRSPSPAEAKTQRRASEGGAGKKAGEAQLRQEGPVRISHGPVLMWGSASSRQEANELITTLAADERGQVRILQGAMESKSLLEMQADAAVVFQDTQTLEQAQQAQGSEARERVNQSFIGVYLEGHVLLRQADRTVRASKIYYDFRDQKALILDGTLRTIERQRNVPIYLRAKEIRQVSQSEFSAKKATITSSDFYRPDYHIGAGKVTLWDITPRDEQGEPTGKQKLRVKADNITMNAAGIPIFWWPVFSGDFQLGETPLHTVKMGYSDNDGFAVETEWWLYRLLGLEEPDNVSAILGLDYMSKRGPVVRYEVDYLRDQYEGYSRGYLIDDNGEDQLGRSRENLQPPQELRGRFLLRHRHYLPDNWEMQLEASYISDADWLEQFEEREFDTGKDQETAIYLKKQVDNWAFSILANGRLMDFINLTEHLPEARFVLIGEPLGGLANGFLDIRGGLVRLMANDEFGPPEPMESSGVGRGDIRAEVQLPLRLGDLKAVPYVSARGTAWDDSPIDGGQQRYFFTAGLRASTQIWRVYDKVESRLLDLHQIRHIIQPEVHLFGSVTNRDHGELGQRLWPFDQEVEELHDFRAVSVALLQTWQTKRGPAEARREVDWLSLNVRSTFFNRQDPFFGTEDFSDSAWPTNMARTVSRGRWVDYRPEYSFPHDNIQADLSLRLSDTTLFFADATYGMNPSGMDRVNVGLAVTRSPRLSYFVADRYDAALDMQVFTAGATYKINEKYTLSGAQQIDFNHGNTLATSMALVRKFPRWYMALTADLDWTRDNNAIMLSIWPEGAPEVRIGTRTVSRIAGGY